MSNHALLLGGSKQERKTEPKIMKTIVRNLLITLFIVAASLQILSVKAAPDSVVQVTADAAGLTPVSAGALPAAGTYWVITVNPNGGLTALPYPLLPTGISGSPIYSITNGIFVVDDTHGAISSSSTGERMSRAQAASTVQSQSQTMENLIEMIENPPILPGGTNGSGGSSYPDGFQIDTNGLYLLATNETPNLGFLLFNPDGSNYQLLSTTNLLSPTWTLGQILFAASGGVVNYFSPVPMTNAMTFYRVHQAYPVMNIQNYQNSEELNPTNVGNTGQIGSIYLYNEGSQTNDVTVYYTLGGTATNGIDYSSLTGSVVVSNNMNYAFIYIDPTYTGLKPDQTVSLTLSQNTNYLIDPSYYSATNTLFANPEVYPTAFGDNPQICPNDPYAFTLRAFDPNNLPLTYSIVTWPTHGILDTNGMPNVTYTPTNCYEGPDSLTFTVNDGTYTSTPATVGFMIADPVYANQVSAQTCRGTPVTFSLGSDNCSENLSYALLSNPAYGTLSGTAQNLTYTPEGTNFTGTDSFNFILYSGCGGDYATNYATITIGDEDVYATAQTLITGTNQPLAITLSTIDYGDTCTADTNDYLYPIISGPTNGVLSGTGANRIYTPANDFEGVDSFQFTVSDGVWTNSPATITIDVTAGPILWQDCNPFSTAVLLDWMLDTNEQNMNLDLEDSIIYRSAQATGPWTAIATNSNGNDSYLDTNAIVGVTNYYVVTIQAQDTPGGMIVESPHSDVVQATAQVNTPLIPYNAYWEVVTNLATPNIVTNLQAPMSDYFLDDPGQPYPGISQLPNSFWAVGTTMSNSITMYIPTNSVPLSQVTYSIAIDNDYQLYLNDSNAPIQTFNHEGNATWAPYQAFEDVAPGLLHYGTNCIRVVIRDEGGVNYFSMIVSTNACGL